jgi:hypothetical protein
VRLVTEHGLPGAETPGAGGGGGSSGRGAAAPHSRALTVGHAKAAFYNAKMTYLGHPHELR